MYLLMNKNNIVAEFKKSEDILDNSYTIIKADQDRLPIGFENIDSWLDKRQAAKHRKHLKELMAECGCLSSEGFIKFTHATSLNDSFWVKNENEDVTWEGVSLYQNEFNDVIAKISFEGNGLFGMEFSSTTPEFSTEGSFEKCWKRDAQEIFLYKRGSTGARNAGMEPYSEVYASQIASILCKKYVEYSLTTLHKKDASKCKLFTSEKLGFLPFYALYPKKRSPREMLKFYSDLGCEDDFRRMIVFDSVTFNIDRHTGNHGVMFDNDTLKIIGMAPVFDFNQSLLPYAEKEDFNDLGKYLEMLKPRIGDDFTAMAKSVLNSEIRADLINLQGFHFEYVEREKYPRERIALIEKFINDHIRGILDKGKMYTVDVFPKSILGKLNENKMIIEQQERVYSRNDLFKDDLVK